MSDLLKEIVVLRVLWQPFLLEIFKGKLSRSFNIFLRKSKTYLDFR